MPFEAEDVAKIKELIRLMDEHGLVELCIEHGQEKICLKRPQPRSAPSPLLTQPVGKTTGGPTPGLVEIKAPIVGTFYRASRPDADPYVEIGSTVEPKTVVCIIEAMKVMNEIKAEVSGTIVEILAKNGQAVEYGQPLFRVKPD